MAFPFTHLNVAFRVLKSRPLSETDAAQFLLGSVAPDAIHYRAEFLGAEMAKIGAAKKITHLCPVSNERWGEVTDNDGWINCVKNFLASNPGPLSAGYAVHVLTDIQNNRTLWHSFRTNYPEEAAKGYTSRYYDDLRAIEMHLYKRLTESPHIMRLLAKGVPDKIPGLTLKEELRAIQNNLLHEHFKTAASSSYTYEYSFISPDDMLTFIDDAVSFSAEILINTNLPSRGD
ncbi:MAG: hypothetical protein FWB91_11725 [Defluviitaleaceae bacterium]|nr:hypothetical protein [Defluviitaleaceae bacterium]